MFASGWIAAVVVAALGLNAVSAAPAAKHQNKVYYEQRNGVNRTIFEHGATGAKMDFVKNSGICETTEGVNQYSGYFSVGNNMNMWFWFFESRNNPQQAPLATWFNGGPGCSSMIGLFQENGPCHFVNGQSQPSLNKYSWNEYANMLYVDQPIGTGFSNGDDQTTSTVTAAPYVWKLLQAFYDQFPQYENRDFGLFTESYGGHYGPEFADYFQQQNSAISSGKLQGSKIPIVALGINNAWIDPILNYQAYVDYSYNNSYNRILTASQRDSYQRRYDQQCLPALKKCTALTGQNSACQNAERVCYNNIEGPISQAKDFDVYDVRAPSNDPNPPETYVDYLTSPQVTKAIGATSKYSECADVPYNKMESTGDNSRSLKATLGNVVNTGISVLLWAGDADWICNYAGNYKVANTLNWKGSSSFAGKSLSPYNVGGKQGGLFKTQDNLSWIQVFGAGHEVPYYQPALALQAFKQVMSGSGVAST